MEAGVPRWRGRYLESLVSLDHVVEGVDGEVAVHYLLLALVLHVGELEVDVDDLFDLHARPLHLLVRPEEVVHHLRVEGVVLVPLEGVLGQDGLRVLPDGLLDELRQNHVHSLAS